MVTGREEVLPIELLEKHTERRDGIYLIFPMLQLGVHALDVCYLEIYSTGRFQPSHKSINTLP